MAGVGPLTQDWEPVVIRKKSPTAAAKKDKKAVNAARRSGAEIKTVKKCFDHTNVWNEPFSGAYDDVVDYDESDKKEVTVDEETSSHVVNKASNEKDISNEPTTSAVDGPKEGRSSHVTSTDSEITRKGSSTLGASSSQTSGYLGRFKESFLGMIQCAFSDLKQASLSQSLEIQDGLRHLLNLASKSGLHLPKLQSLIEDLSQLRDKVSHDEFLHLTSSKEELKKVLAKDSSRIQILLECQGTNEEKLCLLTEKIKELHTEKTSVEETLAIQGAEIEAVKATMKNRQEALRQISEELETLAALSTRAESEFQTKISSFTLDE